MSVVMFDWLPQQIYGQDSAVWEEVAMAIIEQNAGREDVGADADADGNDESGGDEDPQSE